MIFFPEMNIGFRNKIVLQLFGLVHLKAFGVKKMIIQVVLACLLTGLNFFPRGGIFFPMILKWLFGKDFGSKRFLMIIYCMFANNMDDNINLYRPKVLIYNVIYCKFIGNPIKMVIAHNDINVEQVTLSLLLEHIFNPLLYILITNQRMAVKYDQELTELIKLHAIYITLAVIKQNYINNKHHIQSNHKQHQFNLMCAIYCCFKSQLCFIMFNPFTMVQHDKNLQCYHINIMTRNGMASSVCVANTLVAKLFTNIVVFVSTVYRWLGLLYFLAILLIHSGFTAFAMEKATIINSYNTIIYVVLCFLLNVVANSNSNVLMSSDLQNNDDFHFGVVKPKNGFNVINNSNRNQHTAKPNISDTIIFPLLYSIEVLNYNIRMTFELISITFMANSIRFINYDCVFIDKSHNYHLSHYNLIANIAIFTNYLHKYI